MIVQVSDPLHQDHHTRDAVAIPGHQQVVRQEILQLEDNYEVNGLDPSYVQASTK